MSKRLGDEMLAAAEADFEPDFARLETKERGAIKPCRRTDFQLRQQFLDERSVMAAQGLAVRSTVDRAPLASVAAGSERGFVRPLVQSGNQTPQIVDEVGLFPRKAAIRLRFATKMAIG